MASRRARIAGAALAAALAAGLSACGGNGSGGATSTAAPAATAPPAATTAPAATAPPASTATQTTPATPPAETAPPAAGTPETGPATSPEQQPGGAGDEQPMVVPAVLTFAAGGVSPRRVAVPAFFRIRLTGVSRDGRAHTVRFRGARLRVPAGGRASATVDGLPKGLYEVTVDGVGGAVTIASGAEGGP